MIIFNIDSAALIGPLLKNNAFEQGIALYFNDGKSNRRVKSCREIHEEFEGNGMFTSVFMGFRLTFTDGQELHIHADSNQAAKLLGQPYQINNTASKDLVDWVLG
ncbi:hypothetical protein GCE9029_03716 [Grimontia celer]|uniref:Uncharacterized protein n=1 Tax=Grimontia celer TaxID=1796497 RepID=A0A128FAC8_9GAMM|nr:hypothetical protein [Grimontia celer]CZF83241.1 hypothetical protein GCE9029_03716 [Grimontia celer]